MDSCMSAQVPVTKDAGQLAVDGPGRVSAVNLLLAASRALKETDIRQFVQLSIDRAALQLFVSHDSLFEEKAFDFRRVSEAVRFQIGASTIACDIFGSRLPNSPSPLK